MSVNDVLISTVTYILLAKYRIPLSLNLHICYVCHIANLVAQATLATLREVDNSNETDYYALNKGQPLHLDIGINLDQIELDREVFQDDAEDETS